MQRSILHCAAAFIMTGAAHALPPIEAYGELPAVREIKISPDGEHFAYLTRQNGEDYFVVVQVDGKVVGGARTGELKAREIRFITNDHVVLIASETTGAVGFRGRWENSGAVSFNLSTKKMQTLLRGTEDLFPAQTGLGRILGRLKDTNKVFMPAFIGAAESDPANHLMKVDLDTGRGSIAARGVHDTIDWLVDENGVVLAREDWDQENKDFQILTRKDGAFAPVFRESKVASPTYFVNGISPDKSGVIVASRSRGTQFVQLHEMSFDGKISSPIFSPPDRQVEQIAADHNKVVAGVRYSGMYPSYEFFDPALTQAMKEVAALNPDSATSLVDTTADYSKFLLQVEAGGRSLSYWIFDRKAKTIARIARAYPAIDDADIGPVVTIEYKARDGRKIPSVITRPPGAELGETMPLIVMPHGGPEDYDAVRFDWMAQYFASRGYLIFQPNFRGSEGFGDDHRRAGHGEWGGKMQDDITDGVNLLVKNKWADPKRICIIGSSYGGYAALAGGAYTPELYGCVAAIAPVTDLSMFLAQERRESGSDSYVYERWTDLIGDRSKDKAKIEEISPVNAAANFKAPVLLIHGADDTVAPYAHSSKMEAALKKAGKSVKLVKLKGEDHWLSVSETRLQTLRELDAFVSSTIGPNKPASQ